MSRLRAVLRMIQFEHSVFALPFGLSGAWLAARGTPPLRDLALIVVAAVAARSAAMTFNRIADREFDARNPRTAGRALPRGEISARWAAGFTALAAAAFVGAAFLLAPICGWFSFPVLALLLGYSLLKRVTVLCHAGLGLSLACAPTGAWLAVTKGLAPGWEAVLWIGAAVTAWVAGFDILYSIQDLARDREEGLRSFPARFGPARAKAASMGLHALALLLFVLAGRQARLGPPFFAGVGGVGVLLGLEHWLVRGGRDERIPVAFFRVNAWVGVVFFAGLLADLQLWPAPARLGS